MCCGNVDDGKSTFLGRLLYETGNAHNDAVEDMESASRKYSLRKEYSMLLDGLLEERQQQITIDVAHRYMNYGGHRIHILDCPGHTDFLPGVITSAATADYAILVVDVSKPISQQAIKHLKYLSLFQIEVVHVVFNKFDKIDYDSSRANVRWEEFCEMTSKFNLHKIPYFLSALSGNSQDVCQILEDIISYVPQKKNKYSVVHIQNCILHEEKRIYHGKVIGEPQTYSGEWILYPEGVKVNLNTPIDNTGFFSIDEDKDIPRGSCLSNAPLCVNSQIRGKLIYWDESRCADLILKYGALTAKVLSISDHYLKLDKEICFNNINEIRENGFALLIDARTFRTVGTFVFLANEIKHKKKNSGSVIWLTGLSGTGKTTLGRRLQESFSNSILLDADEIRTYVNFDLGYRPEELFLNVQKIAGMAKILSDQGFTVIITCISKYRNQRDEIRKMFPFFYEIHMNTQPENTKGLYDTLSDEMISDYETGTPEKTIKYFSDIDIDAIKAEIMDQYLNGE